MSLSEVDRAPEGLSGRSHLKADLVLAVACLATYLAADVWAKSFSLPGSILIWFPPAGVAIGFCYLRARLVVVVFVAELIGTTWVTGLAGAFGVVGLVANSAGIAAAYGIAGWSLHRLRVNRRLRTPEDLLLLSFACLVVGPVLAAAAGVVVQCTVGLLRWSDFGRSASIFWLGDAIGAICLAPTIVLIGGALLDNDTLPLADFEPRGWRSWVLVLEYVVPSIVGFALLVPGGEPLRFAYLAFVPVVAIAIRHGIAGAALSGACLAALMSVGAHMNLDVTIDRSDFQLLILTLELTGLVIGAVVSARRDVLASKTRLSEIVEATPDLVASVDRDGTVRYLNPAGSALIGVAEGELPTRGAFSFLPDELARDLMRQGMRVAEAKGSWAGENRLRRVDGEVRPISQVLVAHRHPGDDDVSFSTVCRDITDARQLEDQLRRATLYDDSTGLPNRALLTEQLDHLMPSDGWSRPTALLFCDIDHLVRVNETWGFHAADALVASLGGRLGQAVRDGDLIAHYGGSQFVVVMMGTEDEVEPVALADRLLGVFAEPVAFGDAMLKISGSIGIALVASGQRPLDVLRGAEIALHRAQEAGGARYTLFDDVLEERSRHRIEIEADLQRVLESGEWWLAYQPIVDTNSQSISSVEALLRWTHPERGPVAPFDLIRLAERSGTIVVLGREILCRACADAQRWHELGHSIGTAVNVSARQLREPGFVDEVREVLADTGLSPECLTIELTETDVVANEHGEIATLEALRALGCQVALDDFGTGYSSLAELHDLPIDVVKLDQTFIRKLDVSPRSAALVRSVVALAKALGLHVIAEGVERESQVAALTELGCEHLQGYAISRPLERVALEELLVASRT
jgi:diguanylate cyclase (GGDEF)-like protein/PAS domain S-box-containing protein